MPSLKSTRALRLWAKGLQQPPSLFWGFQIEKHEKKYFQSIGKEKRIKIHTQNREKTKTQTPEEATRKMLFIH